MFGTPPSHEETRRADEGHPGNGHTIVRDGPQLPLEARVETSLRGTTIRLPVRAEHVTVEKRAVVVEEVHVRTAQVEEVAHLTDTVRREELRLETEGRLEVAQPGEVRR